ncbi:hypothetical protein [Candidatus Solincola tengchongensis]|uniref:hypothetical protein n=1 Tax=Candidatus Solincola tengchongensis TaxID=2900693 RepID=UPI00257A4A4D|nr:hypothetical protein [Candidatus Solincola tengchongensis]
MREGALEILALLLLGFIAMLAIVPPIIRGKLEDSPLVTTQTFRKSMQEIGQSLEPRVESAAASPDHRAAGFAAASSRAVIEANPRKRVERNPATAPASAPSAATRKPARTVPPRSSSRKAAVRRNRIFAALTLLVLIWGMATLLTGNLWCLLAFSISGFLLSFYWGLTIIIPYILLRSEETRREGAAHRGVRRPYVA